MVLKPAFNLLSRLHSRTATLKRFGTPDIYSPVRIMPSSYFRYLEGLSTTTIRGREFILPIDTMKGHSSQTISFDVNPTAGDFTIGYGMLNTGSIAFDAVAANVQTALRLLAGLENVTVTGSILSTTGLNIVMIGIQTPSVFTVLSTMTDVDDEDVVVTVSAGAYVAWSPMIKRADKIIDSVYGHLAIDEIIEIVDIGGAIMGFRCRCE